MIASGRITYPSGPVCSNSAGRELDRRDLDLEVEVAAQLPELDARDHVAHGRGERVHVHGSLLVRHHEDLGVVLVAQNRGEVAEGLGRFQPCSCLLIHTSLGQSFCLFDLWVNDPSSLDEAHPSYNLKVS